MKNKFLYGTLVFVIVLILGIVLLSNKASSYPNVENFDGQLTMYKSFSCGCCELYGEYFKSQGNKNLKILSSNNQDETKEKYQIPASMGSCHTNILKTLEGKEYFVEGHVPLEAVEKLLSEKPDIKGIAIPGMPDGSPGMPGSKKGVWVVYQINNDGTIAEFMRL